MQVHQIIRAGWGRVLAGAVVALVFISGRSVFAFGQTQEPAVPLVRSAAESGQAAMQAPAVTTRNLTVDDAVAMALESNLGIQSERLNPQIRDYSVAQARATFAPVLSTGFSRTNDTSQRQSQFQAPNPTIATIGFSNSTGIQQQLPWFGGSYTATWQGSRSEADDYSTFNPSLFSSLTVNFAQPLLRNLPIDANRRQVSNSQNLREIADVQLRQNIVITTRNVRNAYWDLVAANANLQVAQQALDLARQSLKDNQRRVEVGTTAPIDIIEAEAEVARNEEAVIVATNNIERAQDQLRVLISNPEQPDFWTMRIEPSEQAVMVPVEINLDTAVRQALDGRSDLVTARRQLDNIAIDVQFYKNQTLPNIDLNFSYRVAGTGGTQINYGDGFPPVKESETVRGFGSVLGDLWGRTYPRWSLGFQVGYPIGRSQAEAALASARLLRQQAETNLRNLEMQIAASVRDVARQVTTNQKRVEATQKARELAERRLDAEQKKFSVGLSTTFVVFQVQRDVAAARANEVRAIIDYNKSLVDFEAVQQAPVR